MGFSEVERCESHLLFDGEVLLPDGARAVVYVLGLGYCFLGLSEITAKFFRAMEGVVGQEREVEVVDPATGGVVGVQREKLWNFSIADVTLLALGTSFPQISLATIDAVRNLGQLYSGGLGPGTLVGSAAFDLFPIHAVCVVVPRAGSLKRISDLGVWLVELFWSFWAYIWLYIILEMWTPKVVTFLEALLTVLQFGILLLHVYAQDKRWPYLSIPLERNERPKDWVPEEDSSLVHNNLLPSECFNMLEYGENPDRSVVELVSIYSGGEYESVPDNDVEESSDRNAENMIPENSSALIVCREQVLNVLKESPKSKKMDGTYVRMVKVLWRLVLMPWRLIFAFVPPCHLAHGWLTFICSLISITGIAYMITKLTDAISCVTGINPYVIALTALAGGTSWPDLVASKIAAERQTTADSSIANITCSNSVNIYIGIGIPWLINTIYNHITYNEPLHVQNAAGLGFTLLVFFATSVGCVSVLVLRRLTLGAELGGPRLWAWATCIYLMLLWITFVVLSSLKVSDMI